jgi:predicted component of type VI protein secretion system
MHQEIADLPFHVYKKEGATQAQPCAELLLTESDWNALLDEGLMPLAAAREADWARLVQFQSIADPAAPLSGRWN